MLIQIPVLGEVDLNKVNGLEAKGLPKTVYYMFLCKNVKTSCLDSKSFKIYK